MKKLQKFALAGMAAALCLGMTACGSKDDTVDNPYGTVTPGVLTVATSPDYAPYEFYAIDEDGNAVLAGFDIDLVEYIADYLDMKLELIPMEFKGVLTELSNQSVDLGVAGISPDPERVDAMDFSDIYYEGTQAFITVESKTDLFTDLESANTPDYSIGAQTGSIQMDLAKQFSPDADIISLAKATDIIAELVADKLDGAYVEYDVAVSYQQNYPELRIVCEVPYEAQGNAVGVAKGNSELLAAVNEAIAACIEDGSFSNFVADAQEMAAGNIYEGLLNEDGTIDAAAE